MADNKTSFLLYCDLIHTVKKLSKQKAGELFLTILSYVNDENPVIKDPVIDLVFEPIKQQLKRDLKDWECTKGDRSNSGKLGNLKRWSKDLYNQVVINKITLEEAEKIAKDRTAIKGIANIAVNDTVTVTVKKKEEPPSQIIFHPIEECLQIAIYDDRWVRANKTSDKELHEFNSLLERRGIYEKNPLDYKTHFANWKHSGKKEESLNTKPIGTNKAAEAKARAIINGN